MINNEIIRIQENISQLATCVWREVGRLDYRIMPPVFGLMISVAWLVLKSMNHHSAFTAIAAQP